MSLFKKYVLTFSSTALIATIVLRLFAHLFLYRTPELFWDGFWTTMGTCCFLLIITCIIGYYILKPFTKTVQSIKSGHKPTDDEKNACLSCYKKLKILTVCGFIIGFPVGQIIVDVLEIAEGVLEYNFFAVAFSVLQATVFSCLGMLMSILTLNEYLTDYRALLELHDLSDFQKQKTINSTATLLLSTTASIAFCCINMFTVPAGFFLYPEKVAGMNLLNTAITNCLLAFAISFIAALPQELVILKSLHRRIVTAASTVTNIAEAGDLTERINITVLDDFGEIISGINRVIEKLNIMVMDMRKESGIVQGSAESVSDASSYAASTVQHVTDAFEKIGTNAKQQSSYISEADSDLQSLASDVENVKRHVEEQSAALQESSASISQMTANIVSVAELAKKADFLSKSLSETSEKGNSSISSAIVTVREIQQASIEVQSIIKMIQKIASQTNLLSMNAAIEAAHAGSAGAGFAVVANEVRALAESSAKSAKDIQVYTKEMVAKIESGVEVITQAGNAFNQIASQVTESSHLISTIAAATEEQRISAEETMKTTNDVVDAIQAINNLTENQSKHAENVRQAMKTVVDSSKQTEALISESTEVTSDLNKALNEVSSSAENNMEAIFKMKENLDSFKTDKEL